nr:zinc finger, CCHC-type [Tanacetum cinerariifolium]
MEEAIGRLKTYEERIKYKKGKQVDNQEKLMFIRHESKGKHFRGRGRGKHRFSQGKSHEKFKRGKMENPLIGILIKTTSRNQAMILANYNVTNVRLDLGYRQFRERLVEFNAIRVRLVTDSAARVCLVVQLAPTGTPLMLDSYTFDMCMQSWGRSSYARAMIELRVDVDLNDNIVAAMPKITREGYYTCTCEINNLKKNSQTSRGISVGQKMGFKPKQVYQPVSKKPFEEPTSVNKKKNVEPTKENVDASSYSTTPVIEKIDKIEKLIIEGKVTLVDNDGKPLEKVSSSCDYDSEDEVESVDNDMAKFLAENDGYCNTPKNACRSGILYGGVTS